MDTSIESETESQLLSGLELLFSVSSPTLRSKLDCLVITLHWMIIKEGAKADHFGKQSELLPPDWNADVNEYTTSYVIEVKSYVLKVVRMDGNVFVHFMESGSEKLGLLNLATSEIITDHFNDYFRAFVNLPELHKKFKDELAVIINPAAMPSGVRGQNKSKERQDQGNQERHDPLRIPHRTDPRLDPSGGVPPAMDPFGIGRGDLDPLRAGQGGMVMDPFGHGRGRYDPGAGLPGGLPRGAVPPGARFDPFGPPDLGRYPGGPRRGPRAGPDPDHMKPPDFDDMFM